MFNNASITPVRKDKPHLVFRQGYWRVSPLPKPYHKYRILWQRAHGAITLVNWRLHS